MNLEEQIAEAKSKYQPVPTPTYTQIARNYNSATGWINEINNQSAINIVNQDNHDLDELIARLQTQLNAEKNTALDVDSTALIVNSELSSSKNTSDFEVSTPIMQKDSRPQIINNYSQPAEKSSNSSLIFIALVFIAVIFFGVLK